MGTSCHFVNARTHGFFNQLVQLAGDRERLDVKNGHHFSVALEEEHVRVVDVRATKQILIVEQKVVDCPLDLAKFSRPPVTFAKDGLQATQFVGPRIRKDGLVKMSLQNGFALRFVIDWEAKSSAGLLNQFHDFSVIDSL